MTVSGLVSIWPRRLGGTGRPAGRLYTTTLHPRATVGNTICSWAPNRIPPVGDTAALKSVVAGDAREPNSGLIVCPDSFMDVHRAEVTSLAARHRLPAVYPFHQSSEIGGLLSYGNDQIDNYRRAAVYVDRILRGAKPIELPVQAPVKFELVINLKTARALGLKIPESLLLRADQVIE